MTTSQTTMRAELAQPEAAPSVDRAKSAPVTSPAAILGRLSWMLIGPFGFLLATLGLFSRTSTLVSLVDVTYPAAVAVMILGRYTEFRTGFAVTGTGEVTTRKDLQWHIRTVLLLAVAIGIIALIVRVSS